MAGDPYWANVSLAMHLDDSALTSDAAGRTVTNTGVSRVTTNGRGAFGEYCAYFGGTQYLTVSANAAMNFGLSDFCVEAWIFPTTVTAGNIFSQRAQATNGLTFRLSGGILQAFYGNGVGAINAGSITANQWTHVAISRSGNTVRIFINGAVSATGTWTSITMGDATSSSIGIYSGGGEGFSGYMDDVRVTKGQARYTAAFDVPSEAFGTEAATYLSGTVKDSLGDFAARTVKIFRSSDCKYGGSVVSNATTGAFSIIAVDSTTHFIVCLPADSTENALIFNNVTPV